MLRYLFLEIVLPLLVFFFLRSIFRSLFGAARQAAAPPPHAPRRPEVVSGGELKKDPVCGTYVSEALSVTRKVNGQVLHFCSKECRDKYHAA